MIYRNPTRSIECIARVAIHLFRYTWFRDQTQDIEGYEEGSRSGFQYAKEPGIDLPKSHEDVSHVSLPVFGYKSDW